MASGTRTNHLKEALCVTNIQVVTPEGDPAVAAAEWQRREKVFGQAEAAEMATALDTVEVIVKSSFFRHKVESKLGLYLGESSNVNVLIYSRVFLHNSQLTILTLWLVFLFGFCWFGHQFGSFLNFVD